MGNNVLQGVGYELLNPSSPPNLFQVPATTHASSTWQYGAWVQLTATLSHDNYLRGVWMRGGCNGYAQIGVGAAGSEVPVTTIPLYGNMGSTTTVGPIFTPDMAFLPSGSRIAVRVAGDVLNLTVYVVPIVIQAENLLGDSMGKPSRILAQGAPGSANTATDLYTATDATGFGSVVVNNTGSAPVQVAVSYAPGGAADAASQYLHSNIMVGPMASLPLPLGIVPVSGDKVRVKTTATGVNFILYAA